jgi:hypothetical protein
LIYVWVIIKFEVQKGAKKKLFVTVMDRLQTSGELQDKTSFIDPSTSVGMLKGCSPGYLLL